MDEKIQELDPWGEEDWSNWWYDLID
jgi:hypothetical protein